VTMANFQILHPKCFNLSDMGTGKTLSTLWAADFIMEETPGMRCLIVCPKTITQRVWGDAITTHFLGKRTYKILRGTPAQRLKTLSEPADFYIINYEGTTRGATQTQRRGIKLGGLALELCNRQDLGIVVFDEARAYSHDSSWRHKVARLSLIQKPYVWCLTGTPIANGPLDAHGIARLVNNAYGESFTSYKRRIMLQVGPYLWKPKRGAVEEAYRLLQPSIRFEMRDCVDVPPCTETMRQVELSDAQKKAYAKLKHDLVLDLEGGKRLTVPHEAALRLKLIQISCGAVYGHDHSVTRIDCAPRLAELRDVIEEAGRKVIIFTPLTSIVHLLYEELKEYSRAKINGEVTQPVRDAIISKFQTEKDPQLIIADPSCTSQGLDLFAASVVVWFGATDKSEHYFQGNRRIDRPGQTVPTTIVQLAATPEEREIYKRISGHQSLQGLMLGMVKDQRHVRQQLFSDGLDDRAVQALGSPYRRGNDPLHGRPKALPTGHAHPKLGHQGRTL
jgi:SNF2 family DNA or RNA helicase